ncbi:LysM and putative peptidoglycan-binding domain-containing protein 3 [Chionoecetes opilio]|uniref:LysM and putative peptidoglycan-binding domain-containing protein 3 n=1 Tax=Chionoecetes opilio TaxID=41210 RepID=A0A8J5D2I3_CHIOP|nr:LysM and putative peptidoglycan-binding domain-containing protein 3 [Chionoecetes opilio]
MSQKHTYRHGPIDVKTSITEIENMNYKYRRLSSTEKGSGICHSSCDEDEEEIFFSQGTEVIKLNGRTSSASKDYSNDSLPKYIPEYEQLVDRPIKHGETLTGLALKYRISVAELKRVNKIIQEKEFYALKTLKIPIKAHSSLAEVLQEEQCQDASASASISSTRAAVLGTKSVSSCSEYESDSEMHVGYISINRILRDTRTKKEAKRFLDSMQKDLANIREKTNSYKTSLDEVAAVLTDPRFQPLDQQDNRSPVPHVCQTPSAIHTGSPPQSPSDFFLCLKMKFKVEGYCNIMEEIQEESQMMLEMLKE